MAAKLIGPETAAAYLNNTLSPNDKIAIEDGIRNGQLILPEITQPVQAPVGEITQPVQAPVGEITQPVQAPVGEVRQIGPQIAEAYWNNTLSPEDKILIEDGIRNGQLILPEREPSMFDEAAEFAKGYGVEGVGELPTIPTWGEVKEQFTGEKRKVPSTEALPNMTQMPEMNSYSFETLLNIGGTFFTDPDETISVIKKVSPDVKIRQDEKGNYIAKSAIDGREYAWKPGFRESDIPRNVSGGILWALAQMAMPGSGLMAGLGKTAATEAIVQASQAALGGKFDVEQIPLAMATDLVGIGVGKGLASAKGAIKRAPSAAQTAVREAEKAGVVPMTSDIMPPKTFAGKTGQAITERIPIVGTGPVRAQQQVSRVNMVKDAIEEFGVTDANVTDAIHADLSKTRKDYLTKNQQRKSDVIERLSKEENIINVDSTVKAFDDEIAQYDKIGTTESKAASKILNEYKLAFQNKNLSGVERVRKEFGGKIKDQGEAIKTELDKSYLKLYDILRDDMGDYIKKAGEPRDYTKWRVANRNISKMINEEKNTILKSMLSKKGMATPEVIRNMLFSKKPSEIKLLYRNLSKDGKANAKVAVLQEIVKKSGGVDQLSTAKFSTNLNKMQNQTGILFNKRDRKILTGIQEALRLTKRAEIAALAPPTGVQNFQILGAIGLGAYAGGEKGAAIGLSAGAAARAYESKIVRNILLQLAKKQPGKEQVLIKQLTTALQVYKRNLKKREKQNNKNAQNK